MHTSCFITSLLLLAPAVWTAVKQDKSGLELITEDFRILARITNAAFLQAAFVRKDVKARDVIVEFLKITPLDFNHITAIDAQAALDTITKTYDDVQNFAKLDESANEKIIYMDDEWSGMANYLKNHEENPYDPNMSLTTLVEEHKTVFEDFEECNVNVDLKAVVDFMRLYPKENSETISKRAKRQIMDFEALAGGSLTSIKSSVPGLLKCFRHISNYSVAITAPNDKFQEYLQTEINIKNRDEDFSNRINTVNLLRDSLKKSQNIWQKESVPGRNKFMSRQLSELIQFHKLHSNSMDAPPSSLTIGFFQPEEMQKVQEDIRSSWFEKHLAKKSSVEPLLKALKTFSEISQTIKPLADHWWPIYRLDYQKAENYTEVTKLLGEVESYIHSQRTEKYDRHVGLFAEALTKCVKPKCQDCKSVLESYKNQTSIERNYLESLAELKKVADQFLKINSINGEDYKQSRAESCFQSLKFPPVINSANSVATIQELKHNYSLCMTGTGGQLFDLFRSFESVHHAFIKVSNISKELRKVVPSNIDFKDVLKSSNLVETMDCLKKENFTYANWEKLKPVTKFLAALAFPPDSENVKDFKSYLGSLAQVKSSLAKVEKTIRDNRPKRSVASDETDPVLALNISRLENENMGTCVTALSNLVEVRARRNQLLSVGRFDGDARDVMSKESGLEDFMDSKDALSRLLKQADDLNSKAKTLREKSLEEMSAVFQEMTNMRGILGDRDKLWKLSKSNTTNNPRFADAKEKWEVLTEINLNFQAYEKEVANGKVVVASLKKRFDHIFGHDEENRNNKLTFDFWLKLISIFFLILSVIAFFTLADLPC